MENNEIKQTLKPQQKSPTTRDTSEEKEVEDLLRSGGLKAHQIARDLGQSRQTINKQLYSMEKKGTVKKCSKSSMWRLTEDWSDDSFSQERFVVFILLKILTVVTYNDYLVFFIWCAKCQCLDNNVNLIGYWSVPAPVPVIMDWTQFQGKLDLTALCPPEISCLIHSDITEKCFKLMFCL